MSSCARSPFLRRSGVGGFVVEAVSLACCLLGGLLVLPGIFVCMRWCCPVFAQQARQTVETVAFDPIRNEGLPTVYGFAEKLILVFFVALNVAGLAVTAITLDPGLFPLRALLARHFLTSANAYFGEKSGFQDLQGPCCGCWRWAATRR